MHCEVYLGWIIENVLNEKHPILHFPDFSRKENDVRLACFTWRECVDVRNRNAETEASRAAICRIFRQPRARIALKNWSRATITGASHVPVRVSGIEQCVFSIHEHVTPLYRPVSRVGVSYRPHTNEKRSEFKLTTQYNWKFACTRVLGTYFTLAA